MILKQIAVHVREIHGIAGLQIFQPAKVGFVIMCRDFDFMRSNKSSKKLLGRVLAMALAIIMTLGKPGIEYETPPGQP